MNSAEAIFDDNYYPVTARFLSADPVIQDITSSQSFNSYAYCMNNPLKYSDPSGYIIRRPEEPYEFIDWSYYYNYGYRTTPGGGGGGYHSYINSFGNNGYHYNENDGNYYSYRHEEVSWGEVYNNYVRPNSMSREEVLHWLINSNNATRPCHCAPPINLQGGEDVRFANETYAYIYMWVYATFEKREYAAYITTNGVIVTPANLNKAGQREFLKYFNPTWENGALFITFENQKYQVIGGIHTHWRDNGDYGYDFSGPDDYTTKFLDGLPFFSMNFNNTMGSQYYDGNYCRPMEINASRYAVLGVYSLIKYIFNYGN